MLILLVGYFYFKCKEKVLSLSIWIIYAVFLCPTSLDKAGSTLEKFPLGSGGGRGDKTFFSGLVINGGQINRKCQLLLGE